MNMKKQLLTLALAAAGLTAANQSFATSYTFYACEGTSFTLAMTNSASYTGFRWAEYGNATNTLDTTANYAPAITLATATTAEKKQYLVQGKTTSADCYSDYDTITVYVLPTPTVTISDDGPYCANDFQSAIMTADGGTYDFTALPSTPTFLAFDWTGSSTGTVSGTNNDTYAGTVLGGTYTVSLKYDTSSFSTNDGNKVLCEGTDSHTLTTTNATTTAPVISIQ
jgi:hypothetical protein